MKTGRFRIPILSSNLYILVPERLLGMYLEVLQEKEHYRFELCVWPDEDGYAPPPKGIFTYDVLRGTNGGIWFKRGWQQTNTVTRQGLTARGI